MASDAIHPAAARGFAAGADAYERARPTYPPGAVDAIARLLDLRPGRTVLELGAGTGKLTRLLVPGGGRIVAVEPVEAMRTLLGAAAPTVEILAGTAEAVPLPDASVDGVVAAQAFHWFDAEPALAEIDRVLRQGGLLVLAWNRRDESVGWVRAMGDAMRALAAGEPRVDSPTWREALERSSRFGPFSSETWHHSQRLTVEGVMERAASVSYIAAAEPDDRAAVLETIARALAADPATRGREIVELPYDTEVMWAGRRASDGGR